MVNIAQVEPSNKAERQSINQLLTKTKKAMEGLGGQSRSNTASDCVGAVRKDLNIFGITVGTKIL